MPTIDQPQLRIDADVTGPNPTATLTVDYTVHWNDYERTSHQSYSEYWNVIGADSSSGEDGQDDTIMGAGAAYFHRLASDGSATTDRQLVIELDFEELDEDPGSNLDEIKVEVSLTPVPVTQVEELSNRVLISG